MLTLFVVTATALGTPAGSTTPFGLSTSEVSAGGIAANDWLGTANTYRAMSGLPPVSVNRAWDAGTRNHSCYMLANGIAHDEVPGQPRYTTSGDDAGNSSNVAVAGGNSTPQDFVEMWMTAPYHAIGLLRPGWRQTSYGECREQGQYGPQAGASIDVIRGTDFGVRTGSPILFPGRNSTIRLTRFIAEWPNPLEACGWTGAAGLPLIAMMPSSVGNVRATMSSPDGNNPTCVLAAGNAGHPVSRSILDGANAVVIVPRRPLADGTHSVALQTGAGNVNWSFRVAKGTDLAPVGGTPATPKPAPTTTTTMAPVKLRDAKVVAADTTYEAIDPARMVDSRIPKGVTRMRAGEVKQVRIAPTSVEAVTANLTAVNGASAGHLTAYDCQTRPNTSTLNFPQTQAVANNIHVALKSGAVCLTASTAVDVIVDVTGHYDAGASASAYQPVMPRRLIDTRSGPVRRLAARQVVQVKIPAGVLPPNAEAAVVNLTAVRPSGPGYLTAFPCASKQTTSNVNYRAEETVANSTIVAITNNAFCVVTSTPTDLVVDVSGYYASDMPLSFNAISPIRMFDSRSTQSGLNNQTRGRVVSDTVRIKVAGVRGIPANTKVVNVNLTGVNPSTDTFLSVFPCDTGFRGTSNVNLNTRRGAAAGGAMVQVAPDGTICVKVGRPIHVILDVTGTWTP